MKMKVNCPEHGERVLTYHLDAYPEAVNYKVGDVYLCKICRRPALILSIGDEESIVEPQHGTEEEGTRTTNEYFPVEPTST